MNITDKYQLTFIKKSNGFPDAISKLIMGLGDALVDFKYSLTFILKNAIQYRTIVSSSPTKNNLKGMIPDEEYFRYWGVLNDIESYGSDAYSVNLYEDKAEISFLGEQIFEIPIDDWIEILQEWQKFLSVNYGNQFD